MSSFEVINDFSQYGLRRTFATRLAHKGLRFPSCWVMKMCGQLKKDIPIIVLKV